MQFGAINRISKFFLMIVCLLSIACGQTAEEKLKESYKYEDKALELRKQGDLQGTVEQCHEV